MVTNTAFKKRQRDDNNIIQTKYFNVQSLNSFKMDFIKNPYNKIIQNLLCSNKLSNAVVNAAYLQSYNKIFTNTLPLELKISNQKQTGKCWIFSALNVMKREMIQHYDLSHNIELSDNYVCFYEKMEKCNYFLSYFMNKNNIDLNNIDTISVLRNGCDDGGDWALFVNLVEKYGIIPKSCYNKSINSNDTDIMNDLIGHKLKEFALILVNEKNKELVDEMKNNMMNHIYNILCKLLGTPPNPNDQIIWEYITESHNKKIIKKITPLKFYNKIIINKLDKYIHLGNDPRNSYDTYYESSGDNYVMDGMKSGFYNLSMDHIIEMCMKSIMDGTSVRFDCDSNKFFNNNEKMFDDKCFNYMAILNIDFNKMTKVDMMNCYDSYPNHSMVIIGVDLDENKKPLKWKIENSWDDSSDDDNSDYHYDLPSDGYYTMSHEWFKQYVYNVTIQRVYVPQSILQQHDIFIEHPVLLDHADIMI